MDKSEIARAPQLEQMAQGPRPGPLIGAGVGLLIGAIIPGVTAGMLALSGKFFSDGETPFLPALLFGMALIGLVGGGAAAVIGAITGWVGRLPELTGPVIGFILAEGAALAFLAATGEFKPQHDSFISLTVLGGGFGFFSGLLIGVALRVASLLRIRATGRVVPFLGGCALTSLVLGLVLGEVLRHLDLH